MGQVPLVLCASIISQEAIPPEDFLLKDVGSANLGGVAIIVMSCSAGGDLIWLLTFRSGAKGPQRSSQCLVWQDTGQLLGVFKGEDHVARVAAKVK